MIFQIICCRDTSNEEYVGSGISLREMQMQIETHSNSFHVLFFRKTNTSIEETHLQVFPIIKNLESYNHNIEI